ncbi:hypothetical protein [Lentilactobacillus kosonis]|uniref:Uncharacterized protein n=1 Tax=Lentilactobacillus kosonis TaxID=2810561 RepID=A0A401FHW6_9LACO|nr:hypothetical protein [Lentilactobacillus kosonis]GAY71963.1 hypothetical protein NBRC111893_109 [Lentilactobacillus kosonis]
MHHRKEKKLFLSIVFPKKLLKIIIKIGRKIKNSKKRTRIVKNETTNSLPAKDDSTTKTEQNGATSISNDGNTNSSNTNSSNTNNSGVVSAMTDAEKKAAEDQKLNQEAQNANIRLQPWYTGTATAANVGQVVYYTTASVSNVVGQATSIVNSITGVASALKSLI